MRVFHESRDCIFLNSHLFTLKAHITKSLTVLSSVKYLLAVAFIFLLINTVNFEYSYFAGVL